MRFKEWCDHEQYEILSELARFCEEDILGHQQAAKFRTVLRAAGMPAAKVAHSERVTRTVHDLTAPAADAPPSARMGLPQWTAVTAALFHDYLERGGSHEILSQIGLPPQTVRAVNALTSDKGDEDPLEHLQGVLPGLDPWLKNIVILVKLSDRLDNLSKRVDAGGVSRKYLEKSTKLVKWLYQQYVGDPRPLMIMRDRMRQVGVKVKRKFIAARGGLPPA